MYIFEFGDEMKFLLACPVFEKVLERFADSLLIEQAGHLLVAVKLI